MTTPDSQDAGPLAVGDGGSRDTTHAALEVSSHALDQDRTAGTQFDAAVVTNITHDHFDYHHDAAHYRESKARLLEHLKPQALVVLNADDPESAALVNRLPGDARWITFGLERAAHIWATILEESLRRHAVPGSPRGRIDRNHDVARRAAQRLQLPGRGSRRWSGSTSRWPRSKRGSKHCDSSPAGWNGSNAANRSTSSSITPTRKTPCGDASVLSSGWDAAG